MTDFEFLSVLISIVIGFGIIHLLSGLGRAFHFRYIEKGLWLPKFYQGFLNKGGRCLYNDKGWTQK